MTTRLHTPPTTLDPLPDPPKRPRMQQEDILYVSPRSALEVHFRNSPDVLVVGNGYLVQNRDPVEGWGRQLVPDLLVAFGVDWEYIFERNGYVISEVGKPPDLALEIASESTAKNDETIKRDGYARLRVSEYWRLDGSGKGYYSQPLSGDRLVDGAYQPVELTVEADGEIRGYSEVLGLYLCWNNEDKLRFWDPATQDYVPTHVQAVEGWEKERAAHIEAEAEIERLREMLR